MANGWGGKREGAGRKGRAEELGLTKLLDDCISADDRKDLLTRLYCIAKAGNLKAIELLFAYLYGRPKERMMLGAEEGGFRVVILGGNGNGNPGSGKPTAG